MQYKFADLKPRFHFPCVLSIIALCCVHCFAGIILGHRCCLLRMIHESKAQRLALGCCFGLQPYVHPLNSLTKNKFVKCKTVPLSKILARRW